jgi:hypothetical protein
MMTTTIFLLCGWASVVVDEEHGHRWMERSMANLHPRVALRAMNERERSHQLGCGEMRCRWCRAALGHRWTHTSQLPLVYEVRAKEDELSSQNRWGEEHMLVSCGKTERNGEGAMRRRVGQQWQASPKFKKTVGSVVQQAVGTGM